MISHGKSILNRTLCLTLSVFHLANLTWQSGSLGEICWRHLSRWLEFMNHTVRQTWLEYEVALYQDRGLHPTICVLHTAQHCGRELGNYICQSGFVKFLASKPVITGHIVHSWVWNARALGRRSKGNDYPSWRLRSCHRNCSVHRNIITAVKRLNFTESGLPLVVVLPYYNESDYSKFFNRFLHYPIHPRLISLSCL